MADKHAQSGDLIADCLAKLDTDIALAANSDEKVPTQKAVKAYVDANAGGGGGGSGISANEIARVDPSGNDSTGVVGDLSKPFLTVQGAIDAIEAGSFTYPIVDIGNNQYFGTTVTTSLEQIRFVGATDEMGESGFAQYYSYVCHDLVLTNPTTTTAVELDHCELSAITDTGSGGTKVFLEDAGVTGADGVAITGGAEIAIAGNGHTRGIVNDAVTSSGGSPITIRNAYVDAIDSTGSNVTADSLSIIRTIIAANNVTLKDSRVTGFNGASGTTYQDTFLNRLGDVAKLVSRAEPPDPAVEGMIYADTDHHLYYYNGTTWKQLDN